MAQQSWTTCTPAPGVLCFWPPRVPAVMCPNSHMDTQTQMILKYFETSKPNPVFSSETSAPTIILHINSMRKMWNVGCVHAHVHMLMPTSDTHLKKHRENEPGNGGGGRKQCHGSETSLGRNCNAVLCSESFVHNLYMIYM